MQKVKTPGKVMFPQIYKKGIAPKESLVYQLKVEDHIHE